MTERLAVTYVLACSTEAEARSRARDIALEQTVELPDSCYPSEIEERIVPRLEELAPLRAGSFRAVLSFNLGEVGSDVLQLMNLLYGNISLKPGILVADVAWPAELLATLPGPRFGIPGIRKLTGVADRPLLCVALKPMGLSSHALAERCRALASAGVDVVKDDHGIADQPSAPFDERLARCQEAVAGTRTLYFPNVTAEPGRLDERIAAARAAGCRGVLVSPWLIGPGAMRRLAETSGLALLAHPSLMGAYLGADRGIAAEILLGDILRMLGSDAVIYPNVGGRFSFTRETCDALNERLRRPLGTLRAAFPLPGGGIDATRVPEWIRAYGLDTMFLVGGSLYRETNLAAAAAALMERIELSARE